MKHLLQRTIAHLTYPALLVLGPLGLYAAIAYLSLEPWIATAATMAAVAVLVVGLERLSPYREAWGRSHGDVQTDLGHLIIGGGAIEGVKTGIFAGFTLLAVAYSETLGFSLWPTGWPLGVQLVTAIVVTDVIGYAFHRYQHTGSAMWWRFHAVHHSAPRLYTLNAFRFHPIDGLVSVLLQVGPLVLLGADEALLAIYGVFALTHTLMQHSNIDLRLGPLNWVFAGPELHRWHHAQTLEGQRSNYGALLIVWDVIFATRRMPQRPPPEDVGIGGEVQGRFPQRFWRQMKAPFERDLWR